MYTLKNDALTVSILDPVADQARFGTRYCTGGYIFQVEDAAKGALLSGPTYPDSFNWFDGQGLPEAFNLSPLRELSATTNEALIAGIGLCDLTANRVLEFCRWTVETEPAEIRMRTAQSFQSYALELTRTISLHGRTLRSSTAIKNTGKQLIPIRWFPHPFFPQTETDELCRFNFPLRFPENPGYEMAPSGFIARKGWPWKEGPFQLLEHAAQTSLIVFQRHPVVGMVGARTSYVPSLFPIWGNKNTFSWEPFFERTVWTGQETAWWIEYDL